MPPLARLLLVGALVLVAGCLEDRAPPPAPDAAVAPPPDAAVTPTLPRVVHDAPREEPPAPVADDDEGTPDCTAIRGARNASTNASWNASAPFDAAAPWDALWAEACAWHPDVRLSLVERNTRVCPFNPGGCPAADPFHVNGSWLYRFTLPAANESRWYVADERGVRDLLPPMREDAPLPPHGLPHRAWWDGEGIMAALRSDAEVASRMDEPVCLVQAVFGWTDEGARWTVNVTGVGWRLSARIAAEDMRLEDVAWSEGACGRERQPGDPW